MVKKIKVLQINNYHYLKGGSETVYLKTGELLQRKGHDVIFFSVRDKEILDTKHSSYFINPVDFKNLPFFKKVLMVKRFFYSKDAANSLEKLILDTKPDIAHLHIFYGRLSLSILPVLKKHKIPVVMTVHEYRMLCPMYLMLDRKGKICEKCAKGNYFHCVFKRCNRGKLLDSMGVSFECFFRDLFFPYEKHIDKFIMVSKFIMKKHIKYKPELEEKSVQIYNFINFDKLTPYHSHENYYLYFGRLSKEKGIFTLLKAWKNFPELKLKIAGSGNEEANLKRMIKENNLKKIKLIGLKKDKELEEIGRKAKFVIVPSEWYENNPMSVIESLALGTPIIGANIGGIPELISDGLTGFLFESKNTSSLIRAIEKAEILDEHKYKEFSKSAHSFAKENFNSEIYYNKLLEVYNNVNSAKS
ncbi:group 1 glycosyl transferase [Thermotomaculum hydrothermale]|uniref:Group 1 glycosyl transferase n=1 Tax=Thermotomaculum hydrothermale TaxID=981385 RepID=A0A7R6PS82_9BACT|nr:glycosyltransferase family 4 protein [Thermotomaculum hydrothermale]BBB33401.1 group 1 glycosyl transferase [Thermotomaculum hydrothermale]